MMAHAGKPLKDRPRQTVRHRRARPLCDMGWMCNQGRQLHWVPRQYGKSACSTDILHVAAILLLSALHVGQSRSLDSSPSWLYCQTASRAAWIMEVYMR